MSENVRSLFKYEHRWLITRPSSTLLKELGPGKHQYETYSMEGFMGRIKLFLFIFKFRYNDLNAFLVTQMESEKRRTQPFTDYQNHSFAIIEWSNTFIVKSAVNNANKIFVLTDDGKLHYIDVLELHSLCVSTLDIKEKVTCIACSETFLVIVTDKGEVYECFKDPNFSEIHKVIKLTNKTVVKIVNGYYHILALTDKGEVYGWGINFYGQLNAANRTQYISNQIKIPNVSKASDIAAMKFMSAIKSSDDGLVYIQGKLFDVKISRSAICEYTNIFDVCNSSPDRVYIDEDFIILNDLERAFNDCSTSDLAIKVQGQYIYVHKSILKIRSSYFKNMFRFNGFENKQRVIQYNDHSYVVYKAYFKYLYTGMINLSSMKDKLDLLILSDKYCEENLERDCIQIIRKEISRSNVFSIKEIAIKYNKKKLEEYCNNFH